VKGYADDVILISANNHVTVLQLVDQRASELDLTFSPLKEYLTYLMALSVYRKEYCQRALPDQSLKGKHF